MRGRLVPRALLDFLNLLITLGLGTDRMTLFGAVLRLRLPAIGARFSRAARPELASI